MNRFIINSEINWTTLKRKHWKIILSMTFNESIFLQEFKTYRGFVQYDDVNRGCLHYIHLMYPS